MNICENNSFPNGKIPVENGLTVRQSGNRKIIYNSSAPSTGEWHKGDLVYSTNPASGEVIGWVCVENGTPGTWKGFGSILT